MQALRKLRPSSAHAIAFVALLVALGGSAYAVNRAQITSKQIKNNSVASKDVRDGDLTGIDVKDDGLTGADVVESSLGAVPLASTATDAAAVGGQRIVKVNYRAQRGSGNVVAFNAGGLVLTTSCSEEPALTATATTTTNNSSIYSVAVTDSTPANTLHADLESNTFDAGVPFNVLAGGVGNIELITLEYIAPDGTVATGILVADELGDNECTLTGDITVG